MKYLTIDNEYDGRIHKNFKTVNEKDEILLTSALSDYFVWYNKNKHEIDVHIKTQSIEVNKKTIAEYWINNIAKTEEVLGLIESIEVLADVFAYSEKYFDKIISIKTMTENNVLHIKDYRNNKQANRIKDLFDNNSENDKVKEIMKYLSKKKIKISDLDSNQASRIIIACEKSLKSKGSHYEH